MRLQTYFTFTLSVDKRYKKDYLGFCRKYMPFSWDEVPENTEETKEIIEAGPDFWEAKEKQLQERRDQSITKKVDIAKGDI